MKKLTKICLLIMCSFALLIGCSKISKENNSGDNSKDISDSQGNVTVTEEPLSDDMETEEPEGEILKSPGFEKEVVSNVNDHTFNSTIATEDDKALQSYHLDQQIQTELENGEHLFDDPFVILNPFGNSPLTAIVLFQTKEECAVRVIVEGNTDQTDVVGNVEASKLHRVPVIGLYPDKENQVTLQLLDKDGNVTDETVVKIKTDPLPSSMDNIVKVEKSDEPSAYGLIEVSGFGTPHPFAFDTEGYVRWYLSDTYASYGYFPLSNDHFIVMDSDVMIQTYEKPHAQQLYEMDYLGRVYQIYLVENGAHHEIIEMTPGGNLLVVTNSIDEHVEDMVQEIDRETGEIVKSLDMREIFGDTYVNMMDWAHVNTASYNAKDDTLLLSVRNVHSAIKVNWSTNELIWILGNPEFWKDTSFESKVLQPVGDIVWNYQQHSVYEISQNLDNNPDTVQIMMYDNHWDKTRKVDFFDDLESSYVSLFAVDEKNMTVSQLHLYEGIKSKITSNFTYDAKANRVFSMGGYLAEETEDGRNGMIYEFDYDSEEILNQYSLRYTFYRAYEFNPDYNTCASPMALAANYLKGTLRAASLNTKAEAVPKEVLQDGVSFSISGQLLYIKAGDHKVSKVEFVGKQSSYLLDMSYTQLGEKKYQKLVYNIVVPFSNLESDDYQLVITYDGVRYNTNETITIN